MALQIGIDVLQVTIASGTSLSPEIDTGAKTLHGIAMPAAWDTAGLSFQVSVDGGATFQELLDARTSAVPAFTITSPAGGLANQYLAFDPVIFRAVNAIKIRSGLSGGPLNQTANRVLSLVIRQAA